MARHRRPMVVERLLAETPGALQPLLRRAVEMQADESRLRALLDTEVSEQVDALYVRDDTLVVVVRSPAWATRLRFQSRVLASRLAGDAGLPAIRRVRVVVGHRDAPPPTRGEPRPSPPTAEAAHDLHRSAAALAADDPIRLALERIAARALRRDAD